jgi:hypothetical protein
VEGSGKLNIPINLIRHPIPTQKCALAASILLKTISTDAATIRSWAIHNSGATSHFLTTNAPATNTIPATAPLIARLTNGDKVQSTHTCTLNLPNLPPGAQVAHIIPGLASHSILSFVTMCNAGCAVTFTKINCTITYRGCIIICGHKCTWTGLWMVPITSSGGDQAPSPMPPTAVPTSIIAANVDATSSATEYARYIHQCLCSPPTTTLLGAVKHSEELATIPGLTPQLFKSHLPCSTATNKGHMLRHRSNTASTQNVHDAIVAARTKVDHMFSQQELCGVKDFYSFAVLADTITGTMYTNITGAFPVRLFKSMQYIFVAYIYDLNAIIVRAMPSRTDAVMVTAFNEVISTLKAGGYTPSLNVMDNKRLAVVEKYIKSEKIGIQLVPPHNHRVNAAEHAIATFKEHFIAALATVDTHLPIPTFG